MSTSTPELRKLTKPGETLTLAIMSAALLKMGSYPEVEFVGLDGQQRFLAIRVPQKSTDRQLGRAEPPITDYVATVGKLLTFSRDPNAKKPTAPYWSISVDGDAEMPPQPASRPQSSAQPAAATPAAPTSGNTVSDREKYSTAYKRITEFVLSDIVPLYTAKEIPITADVCHAMAATLFIGVTRNGH